MHELLRPTQQRPVFLVHGGVLPQGHFQFIQRRKEFRGGGNQARRGVQLTGQASRPDGYNAARAVNLPACLQWVRFDDAYAAYFFNRVIFVPCRPSPAINPFWPNVNA